MPAPALRSFPHPSYSREDLRHQVHIIPVRLTDATTPTPQALTDCLAPDEMARAQSLSNSATRHCFIEWRVVLRSLLGAYLQQSPATVSLAYGPFGKPMLDSTTLLRFNLAHSADLAVFAFTLAGTQDTDIGVDVERLRSHPRALDIARRFFSRDEVAYLQSVPDTDRDSAFFLCWTRKEACVKALGQGLEANLQNFSVLGGNSIARLQNGRPLYLYEVPAIPEAAVALACTHVPATILVSPLRTIDQLLGHLPSFS
jgi:phosphopantetheine--protein transferase-like protein